MKIYSCHLYVNIILIKCQNANIHIFLSNIHIFLSLVMGSFYKFEINVKIFNTLNFTK